MGQFTTKTAVHWFVSLELPALLGSVYELLLGMLVDKPLRPGIYFGGCFASGGRAGSAA